MPQERWHFYRDQNIRGWRLVDTLHPSVEAGQYPVDSEAVTTFEDDQILAILKGARHDEWLDRVISSTFDKELIREHLKLLNKLVDKT